MLAFHCFRRESRQLSSVLYYHLPPAQALSKTAAPAAMSSFFIVRLLLRVVGLWNPPQRVGVVSAWTEYAGDDPLDSKGDLQKAMGRTAGNKAGPGGVKFPAAGPVFPRCQEV
jgi:hypothetical protein